MKLFKLKLWKLENVIIMKVLEQENHLRCNEVIAEFGNGFRLCSYDKPALCERGILLRGTDRYADDITTMIEFSDCIKAHEYLEELFNLLDYYYGDEVKYDVRVSQDMDVVQYIIEV